MSTPIIVVSGLPRSGTSLMMQILEKAGVPIYTDHKRIPDENNPKGYYEHEAVKRLARDNSWLPEAEGKAVKIIAQLLFSLPGRLNYKIIFINRDINEIIESQQKMLNKEVDFKAKAFPLKLYDTFLNTLKKIETWSKTNYNAEFIFINHRDLITSPKEQIKAIIRFLEIDADVEELAKIVDKNLYRVKK